MRCCAEQQSHLQILDWQKLMLTSTVSYSNPYIYNVSSVDNFVHYYNFLVWFGVPVKQSRGFKLQLQSQSVTTL